MFEQPLTFFVTTQENLLCANVAGSLHPYFVALRKGKGLKKLTHYIVKVLNDDL